MTRKSEASMKTETYRLEIMPGRDTTIRQDLPDAGSPRGLLLLAHGLNNHLDNPLLVSVAHRAAEIGLVAVRFNFLFREAGLDQADQTEILLDCWRKVYEHSLVRWSMEPEQAVVGGKSLGARITALAVGQGSRTAGLVHLGFPLYPPGRPDQGREALLRAVGPLPQLFFAGTRDHLCPLEALRLVLSELRGPTRLQVIEGGDHSFRLPDNDPRTEADILAEVASQTGDWLTSVFTT